MLGSLRSNAPDQGNKEQSLRTRRYVKSPYRRHANLTDVTIRERDLHERKQRILKSTRAV